MRKNSKWTWRSILWMKIPWPMAVVVILLSTAVPIWSQLQQSGGTASVSITGSLPSGSNTIGAVSQNGTWTVQPGNTANTTAWLVTGSGGTFPVTGTFWQTTQPVSLSSLPALAAGTNVIGYARVAPLTSCGTTIIDTGNTTLTTTATAVETTSTCVQAIYLNNITSSAATVTISDDQSTVTYYVDGFSVPANSNMLLTFGGIKFASGVKWSAGTGSAINAQLLGYQ